MLHITRESNGRPVFIQSNQREARMGEGKKTVRLHHQIIRAQARIIVHKLIWKNFV